MKTRAVRSFSCAILAAILLPLFVQQASALSRKALLALPVAADENLTKTFGRFDAFLRKLKQAGHECRSSPYANGVNLNCGPEKQPLVLIDAVFAPTRAPEFLEITSIRANGINGGEMAKAQFVPFLQEYLKPAAKRAR